MITPKQVLGGIAGGRVLDVATGKGGFIEFLIEGLASYDEIIGIDSSKRGAAAFAEDYKDRPGVHFEQMDARQPSFPNESFDMVCIANSLHHFDDPAVVLRQMKRLLRRGKGHFVVAEMVRDGQTETQMTHVYLHHWWAAVDRATGVVHNETYRRDEIMRLLAGMGIGDWQTYDLVDLESDPKDPEILEDLGPVFDTYIKRAEGHPELQQRGEDLRRRVEVTGFHSATTMILVGVKR